MYILKTAAILARQLIVDFVNLNPSLNRFTTLICCSVIGSTTTGSQERRCTCDSMINHDSICQVQTSTISRSVSSERSSSTRFFSASVMGITFPASAASYNQTKMTVIVKVVNVRQDNIHQGFQKYKELFKNGTGGV